MIYMVEMALLDTARRAEWDAWYVAHQQRLLALPGFRATQRFEAVHPADAPFVALHQVDGSEVFETPAYRAQAGPTNTGDWRTRMGNWHRNLFAGIDRTPDVSMDACLLLVEDGAVGPESVSLTWLTAVGLDRSVARRGLAVTAAAADAFAGRPGLRVLRPIGPRLTVTGPH